MFDYFVINYDRSNFTGAYEEKDYYFKDMARIRNFAFNYLNTKSELRKPRKLSKVL